MEDEDPRIGAKEDESGKMRLNPPGKQVVFD